MLESWLLPWLPGAKLLPCVLGVTLNPGGASLVASGVALVCQGLLGAPVPLQPAGKGQGGSSSHVRAGGEAWLDVKPWQRSPRVSLGQGGIRSVSLCPQTC